MYLNASPHCIACSFWLGKCVGDIDIDSCKKFCPIGVLLIWDEIDL